MGTDNSHVCYGIRSLLCAFACSARLAIHFPHYGEGRILSIRQLSEQISLSFETRDGRRYFVIKARDKNGLPRERIALMAKKGVTEEDVQRFLYDVNLAHLYVASEDDTRGSAKGC